MILSVVFVFFRDLDHVVPILMQIFYFSTPIIYPEDSLPDHFRQYLKYNPFLYLIDLVRKPFSDGSWPSSKFIIVACSLSSIVFLCGLFTLKKYDNRVIFKL